jgi:hypothetical protein
MKKIKIIQRFNATVLFDILILVIVFSKQERMELFVIFSVLFSPILILSFLV